MLEKLKQKIKPTPLSRDALLRTTKDYFFITLGMALYAFGFTAFILPSQVVLGGLAGVGTLVYFWLGIPVAVTQYVCNLILLAIAYKIVGKKFVMGTLFGATIISVWVGLFQPLFADGLIVSSGPFMNIVIGSAIIGFGIGLTFTHNGSSGGTDIIAAMVSKHSNVTVGRMMLYTDVFIISSSYFLFHTVDRIVYGFVCLCIISYIADLVINTNRQAVQFTIISNKWREIATAINNDAKRGCTVLDGMGWYSKSTVRVLLVMCRKIESVTIMRIVKAIDKDAFITQANVNGVYGKGFDEMKVKMKPEHVELSKRINKATLADFPGAKHNPDIQDDTDSETTTLITPVNDQPSTSQPLGRI